ncbi:MAG: ComEC/Rec2 family competence protein [Staphylococcus sp.]|nr:ComEC/Rec2 family competence protein [Staphylococcus sp.]
MSLALSIGFGVAWVNEPGQLPEMFAGKKLVYSGVAEEVRNYEPTQVLIVRIDSCANRPCRPFRAKLTIPSSLPEIAETNRLALSAVLTSLTVSVDLPGEIDYDAQLRRSGVVSAGFVRPDSVRLVGPEPGLLNALRRFQPEISALIGMSALSPRAKEFLDVTLTGDRSMLSPTTREAFSVTGLSHFLALSGLHVSILILVASVILIPLTFSSGLRRWRPVVLICLLWLFAIITGMAPSVVRSVIMGTLFLLACMMQRRRSPFNSLCVAAIAILIVTPHALYSVGFQLSFIAVASILLFAEKLNPFSRRRGWLYGLAAYPAVTIAAMLGTAAVSAYYFNIFPLCFLPVNFFGALLLPFILGCGAVFLIFESLGITLSPLAGCIDFLVKLLYDVATVIGSQTWAVVDGIYLTPPVLIGWFLCVGALALWLYKRRQVYGYAVLVCVMFSVSVHVFAEKPGMDIEIFIPRSHSHTSLLIRDGNTLDIMTSAPLREHGELRESYGKKYRPYLLARGIDSMRFHAVSHPEHIRAGGKRFVMIATDSPLPEMEERVDYALVCAGFRGDVVGLATKIKADTILLSSDLNNRRHARYLRELQEAGIAVRSLRERGYMYCIGR